MVSSPLLMTYSLFAMLGANALCLLGLFYYAVTILLGLVAIRKIRTAKSKDETISFGALTLLFVNLIAGILILCMSVSQFPLEGDRDKYVAFCAVGGDNDMPFALVLYCPGEYKKTA